MQKHMNNQRLTAGAEWFDSLHPLHLTPRQNSVFPSEGQRGKPAAGRGIGHFLTFFSHGVV
jgi:hypothetical protein